jgi:hypothetical protein
MKMNDSDITSLEDLRRHLQIALQLEHATLPPYFCALYSIVPGTNQESINVIKSVLFEEMLHMTLAANLLNAIGGAPAVDDPEFIADYPTPLPHSDNSFLVSLRPFSPEAIEMFMRIEKPEDSDARAEAEGYETIGQFYCSLEDGFKALCATLGEKAVFCGDPARQITPDMLSFKGDRHVVPVFDLASALVAIDEIEEQGEGLKHAEVWDGDRDMFHPDRDEVAHYFRFAEIVQGCSYQRGDTPQSGPTGDAFAVDWSGGYPMRENPRTEDYPEGSDERARMTEFRQFYSDMLRKLHRAFNGEPARLGDAISAMFELRDRARELMQMPNEDGVTSVGPSFEYLPPVVQTSTESSGLTITV